MNIQAVTNYLEFLPDIQEVCPVVHRFSDKVYIREIFMPAGTFIVGKTHKTRHFNIVLTGSADVMINGEIRFIQAPYTFESLEGSQKTLYIHQDCRWMTIHVNEDDEKDTMVLEERYIDADDTQPLEIIEQMTKFNERILINGMGNNSSCSSREHAGLQHTTTK